MKIVQIKREAKEMCQLYGEFRGVSVELHLLIGQKWRAKKHNGYWWLSRKGTGLRLRLTDAAMFSLFEEVKENV